MNNTNYQPPVNNDFSSSEYHTTKFEGYPDFTGNNKKKNNSAKYAVMGVVIAVLLAAVSVLGFLLLKTDKPEKITTMLENGQYSKAYDYYIEEYGRGNADDALIDALKIRINDLEADFNDELIEAEEVLEELDTLKNMKIKEIQDMLDELISYISAFNDGDNQQSDTVEAVTQQPDTTATTAAPTTEKPLQTEPIEEEQSYPAPVIISATTLYGDVLPSSNVNINRSFDADKTIDGYYDSCWCVTTGNEAGAGGKIRYDLQAKSKLSGVKLVNGNLYKPVEEELYLLNGQVEYFTLTFSDGSKKQFLASYNRSAAGDFQYFTFDTPVYTDYIIFTVDTGYPGEYYGGNVCLGEFDVF